MTNTQLDALAKLVRMKEGPSKVAVKLVLVDGVAPSDAALATGLSPQSVSNALRRCRTGLALAWIAAGVV